MSTVINRNKMINYLITIITLFSVFFCYAFTIYDATLYKNKPDLSEYGVKPIEVFYAQHVWPKDHSRNNPPPFEGIKHRLKKASAKSGDLVVLDFEHWPLQGYRYKPWKYEDSISKYIETINRFKSCRPDLRFGYFGVIPVNNFGRAISPVDSKSYLLWQSDVRRLIPLTDNIDAAFPVAYTYNDDPNSWNTYFLATMFEAKSIFNGKIYPFIWPQYFDHAPAPKHLRLEFINASFWRYQLEKIYKHAEGVVIWGGWDFARKHAANWNDKAPWWQATKEFIADHAITPTD